MQNKGGIVPEPPEKLYTTPGSESGRPNNDGRPPALSGQSRLETIIHGSLKHERNGVDGLLSHLGNVVSSFKENSYKKDK